MGIWGSIVTVLLLSGQLLFGSIVLGPSNLIGQGSSGGAVPEKVREARRHIKAGKFQLASKTYAKITPGSRLWPLRVEDSIRFQLSQKRFQEAWRTTQVAYRTGLTIPRLDYYTAISATKSGACPLGFDLENRGWRSLLAAYAYRFPHRFQSQSYRMNPYDAAANGRRVNHLESDRRFHLRDIRNAKVLNRMGCRFVRSRFTDLMIAKGHEFRHLKYWFELQSKLARTDSRKLMTPQTGHDEAVLRLAQLASEFSETELLSNILEKYKKYTREDWLKVKEPENRFIWQKMNEIGFFKEFPVATSNDHAETISSMILRSSDPGAVYWLGAVKNQEWTLKKQLQLVDALLKIDNINLKNHLYHKKAWILYYQGEMQKALAVVRSLLIEGETDGDQKIEASIMQLAASIFSEFQYDKKVLGAIQSSVPSHYWGRIFRSVLFEHALSGQRRGFDQVNRILTDTKKLRTTGITKRQLKALVFLLKRKINKFSLSVEAWQGKRRYKSEGMRFFEYLAEQVIALDEDQKKKIEPYLQVIAKMIARNMNNSHSLDQLQEMIAVFDPDRELDFSKGSASVKRGSVSIGVVNLREDRKFVSIIPWKFPERLPLRDLLVVPKTLDSETWVIE